METQILLLFFFSSYLLVLLTLNLECRAGWIYQGQTGEARSINKKRRYFVKEEQQFPRNINIINEIRIKTATKRIRSSRGVFSQLGFLTQHRGFIGPFINLSNIQPMRIRFYWKPRIFDENTGVMLKTHV